MNKDLLFAASVSVLAHGSVAWFGSMFHHPVLAVAVPVAEKPFILHATPPEPEPIDVDDHQEAKTRPSGPQYESLAEDLTPHPSPIVVPIDPRPPTISIDPIAIIPPQPPGDGGPGGPGGPVPFNLGDLDHAPQALVKVPPSYPFSAKRSGLTGSVTIEFIVDAKGNVAAPHPADSGDNPDFDAAAIEALRKWRFHPGIKDGRAVATRMQIPIVFNLDQN